MAVIDCNFYSKTLDTSTSMKVILPQCPEGGDIPCEIKKRFNEEPNVLYLLHGYSGDHNSWLNLTSILRYTRDMNIIVVMPSGGNSYYTNMMNNFNYWTFLSEELPDLTHKFFKISKKPEKTFVAGLSMGGYGAFKLALTYPERFAAAGSFSGALDNAAYYSKIKTIPEEKIKFDRIFGDMNRFSGSGNDLFKLVNDVKNKKSKLPGLFQCCGTEDFFYQENINFRNCLVDNKIQLTYEEAPGEHNWDFWDVAIKRFLNYIS